MITFATASDQSCVLLVCVQVIIQGFRSYRDQTVVDPFSPKHNVIGEYAIILIWHIVLMLL